jgi:hypothetical protein
MAGAIWAITGLVVGLHAYAPTAPFAVLEAGLPASVAGGIVGLIAGGAALAVKAAARVKQRRALARSSTH